VHFCLVLFISFLWEWIKDCCISSLVCVVYVYIKQVVYIYISMPKSAYWSKICLLNENVPIYLKRLYWPKCAYWMKMCLPKSVYWNVITIHIGYTKRCLLTENMPIGWKYANWMKWCLPKGIYWNVITLHIRYIKRCLLAENVSIEGKCVY